MTFDYKAVGGRIKQLQTFNQQTQEELAELADISANHLSALENGRSAGSLDKYYSVAQAWGSLLICLLTTHLIVHPETTTSFKPTLPLVSSLSVEQRKMLIDFIEL